MLDGFDDLTPAERLFLDTAAQSSFTRADDGAATDAGGGGAIRAGLLRAVLLRAPGAPRLHESGLRLVGATVTGALDLEGCRLACDLRLLDCRFDAPLNLRSCVLDTLQLDGSRLPGLLAEKLEARGGVYLRGIKVTGLTELRGAQVGAGINADNAIFDNPGEEALAADGVTTRAGLLLRAVTVDGAVALSGARLGGALDASFATLRNPRRDALAAPGIETHGDVLLRRARVAGRVTLTGADVGGDVDLGGGAFRAPDGEALLLNRARIAGALMLREDAAVEGLLNLNGASAESLADAPESWPARGELALNQFTYNGFLLGPSDAATRLDWLSRQAPARWGEDFWPQPYQQLAQVLTASGHRGDARRVMVEKERLQRRAQRAQTRPWAARVWLWLGDGMLGLTIGYGLRPLRAFTWLLLAWLFGVGLFTAAEEAAAVRPAPPVVVRSPEWVLCGAPAGQGLWMPSMNERREGLARPGETQLTCWRRQPEAAAFTKYNPLMFAFDKMLPGSATGQTEDWALDTRTDVGLWMKRAGNLLGIVGGALSLLALAGFSGIVRSD